MSTLAFIATGVLAAMVAVGMVLLFIQRELRKTGSDSGACNVLNTATRLICNGG